MKFQNYLFKKIIRLIELKDFKYIKLISNFGGKKK